MVAKKKKKPAYKKPANEEHRGFGTTPKQNKRLNKSRAKSGAKKIYWKDFF